MPLFKTITPNSTTQVYIWKVEEPLEVLAKSVNLTPHCQTRFDSMKSELHRKGFLSIRHLLHVAGYTDQDLYYTENGKPHLKDGKHISITHSYNFTAIIVSDISEVGIDIEMQRDKILRIASRFTPLKEYKTLANDEAVVRKLTIVWGAKESLYKIYGVKGLSFLQHINVADFDFDDYKSTAVINYHGSQSEYSIDFLEFEGFTCVYALAL
ncbi:4'-phosphopantetheinyl transferase family protein [Leeuwenhoekiella sp. MAR_2009_132]|uniref:4'-phosphopantetheinyl transferase family protein n=1 Tax=Leeuwenhoekiella sp. MAR_2009_132 TaxID=1392489 RepID=UPI000491864D|nr:4'-phosphopantetheinyl transferase superfamily protein [Leeuwenhoekiella sp. MAR_2009_132]